MMAVGVNGARVAVLAYRVRCRAAVDEMRKSSGAGGSRDGLVAACTSSCYAGPALATGVHFEVIVMELCGARSR